MLGEVLVPVMQGERVVLAQVLLMHHVEAGVMDARFDEAGRAEITVREDVTVEEFVGTGLAVRLSWLMVIWWFSSRPIGFRRRNISSK